ncbi:MAG: hypothetical protein ACREN2_05875 [Candidatus Dormibacteria bacterium]
MFRALGARLRLDCSSGDADEVTVGAVQAVWEWAARGMSGPQGWTEGELRNGLCRVETLHSKGTIRELYRTTLYGPDEWETSTLWRTTVDLVHSSDSVEIGFVVEQDVIDPSFIAVPLQPPLMQLLRDLAQRGASAGSQPVGAGANAVVGTAGVERFVSSVLLDRRRTLPVLLFTAVKEHDGVFMPERTDPSLVARELCGLAHVYLMPRVEDTHKLTKQLGLLSAYDGAVRLYWPGLRLTDRPPRHPLHLRARLNSGSIVLIMRRIVDAAARGYRPPMGTQSLMALRWRRQERRQVTHGVVSQSLLERRVATLNQELDHALTQNVRLSEELETVRIELERAQERLLELPGDGEAPGFAGWHRLAVDAVAASITVASGHGGLRPRE